MHWKGLANFKRIVEDSYVCLRLLLRATDVWTLKNAEEVVLDVDVTSVT